MLWLWVLAGVAVLVFLECIREVHTFRVTHYQIPSPKLCGARKHTIILLSDLHGQSYGRQNEILLEAIRGQNPEAIFIAGDMLVGSKMKSPQVAEDFVKALVDICPVFYANGNHEQRLKEAWEIPGTDYLAYRQSLIDAGVQYLENTKAEFSWDGVAVDVYGLELGSEMFAKFRRCQLPQDYMERALGAADDGNYNILIAHNPVYAKEYAAWGADLTVSGHLHGGIVRIPFWRGVISPQGRLFPKHSGELRMVDQMAMVVSKGIGIHTIKLRFFNPAEVVVLHVGNSEGQDGNTGKIRSV